jgi:hypothetical protein
MATAARKKRGGELRIMTYTRGSMHDLLSIAEVREENKKW